MTMVRSTKGRAPPKRPVFSFSSAWRERVRLGSAGGFVRFPCRFAVPKRIGLKSNRRLPEILINPISITSSDVSTHLRPGWRSLRAEPTLGPPLYAIIRSKWNSESAEARSLPARSLVEPGSWFCPELSWSWCSWINQSQQKVESE